MKSFYFFSKLGLMALVIIFYSGCGSDDPEPIEEQPVADFSFEAVEDTPLTISFSDNSLNYQTS
jgi:PKD repeat protein